MIQKMIMALMEVADPDMTVSSERMSDELIAMRVFGLIMVGGPDNEKVCYLTDAGQDYLDRLGDVPPFKVAYTLA